MIELQLEKITPTSQAEIGDILYDKLNTFLIIYGTNNRYCEGEYTISVLDLKSYKLNALNPSKLTSYRLIKNAVLSVKE